MSTNNYTRTYTYSTHTYIHTHLHTHTYTHVPIHTQTHTYSTHTHTSRFSQSNSMIREQRALISKEYACDKHAGTANRSRELHLTPTISQLTLRRGLISRLNGHSQVVQFRWGPAQRKTCDVRPSGTTQLFIPCKQATNRTCGIPRDPKDLWPVAQR